MIQKMHHTGFVVSDLDRAVEFYESAIGLEVKARFERRGGPIEKVVGYNDAYLQIAIMGIGGEHVLELIKYVSPTPGDRPTSERSVIGGSHLAFTVDDIQAAYKNLSAAGANMLNAPVSVAPGKTVCYLQDLDGNWLELMEFTE